MMLVANPGAKDTSTCRLIGAASCVTACSSACFEAL
jgi:hypothetical protein